MNAKNKITSIRRFLLSRILAITTIVLLTTLISAIFIAQEQARAQLEQSTTDWANTLAKLSAPYLINNNKNNHNTYH